MKAFRDGAVSGYDKEAGLIEIAIPVTVYDSDLKADITEGVLVAAASPEKILRDVAEKERRSVIIEILAIVLLTGVAAAVASVVVRPFDKVTGAIRSAASFDDSTPAVSDYKETEEIVEAFNEMRTQMKALDQSRQEFVGNVSHELKTPMASIKVLADSINMQSDAPVEVYRDFMKDISEEIDRENNIISDLLALVKMDKGVGALNIENKNINMLLENIIRRLGPLAKKNEVDIVFESIRQVDADVDETKISSAFMNLIENGIKYNKKPGWVRVKLDADHRFFTVTVSDSGMGIPEESLPHIFERFYRVDKSHSREIGGTGLGLAITRRTILLHRGSIKAESVLGEGTVFTVRIPVGYIA
ncbi:MAG: Alkaline phosphatase synthesis sensor protein PhoR [Firmicutes bacterium ADurb.Bin354]|nr:MAG: Alkaline phosphatase synthesis sensor protein PhoR [Firmicutes bacterium ADurb.Bin354]